jgi:hypothetical protein
LKRFFLALGEEKKKNGRMSIPRDSEASRERERIVKGGGKRE